MESFELIAYESQNSCILQQYRESMLIYEAALRCVEAKLEVLKNDFKIRYEYDPIHNILTRLKSMQSIEGKLRRKGLPITISSAEEYLHDIAGVRVVCGYVSDIYRIADMLSRQQDVAVIDRKDYISEPKPSGYRSLHLVVRVPVYLTSHTEEVCVEIQLRTIAMDFWASLEHDLRYKTDSEKAENAALRERLRRCAEISSALDIEMESIYHEIKDEKID